MSTLNHTRLQRIQHLLSQGLAPEFLEVVDDSAKHIGHAGYHEGEITHVHIHLQAQALKSLSRLARHRKVMDLLAPEFQSGLHAAAIQFKE